MSNPEPIPQLLGVTLSAPGPPSVLAILLGILLLFYLRAKLPLLPARDCKAGALHDTGLPGIMIYKHRIAGYICIIYRLARLQHGEMH